MDRNKIAVKESNQVRESVAISSHFCAKVPRISANNGGEDGIVKLR